MPEIWARAPDATNRKLREIFAADQSAVTRKMKALWSRDNAAVNRKIFSGYDCRAHNVTWSPLRADGSVDLNFSADGYPRKLALFMLRFEQPINYTKSQVFATINYSHAENTGFYIDIINSEDATEGSYGADNAITKYDMPDWLPNQVKTNGQYILKAQKSGSATDFYFIALGSIPHYSSYIDILSGGITIGGKQISNVELI